jgi:hypothetical protein
MKYEKLLCEVAKIHNTTPEQVEAEMTSALNATGSNITPQAFIAIVSAKAKNTLSHK